MNLISDYCKSQQLTSNWRARCSETTWDTKRQYHSISNHWTYNICSNRFRKYWAAQTWTILNHSYLWGLEWQDLVETARGGRVGNPRDIPQWDWRWLDAVLALYVQHEQLISHDAMLKKHVASEVIVGSVDVQVSCVPSLYAMTGYFVQLWINFERSFWILLALGPWNMQCHNWPVAVRNSGKCC